MNPHAVITSSRLGFHTTYNTGAGGCQHCAKRRERPGRFSFGSGGGRSRRSAVVPGCPPTSGCIPLPWACTRPLPAVAHLNTNAGPSSNSLASIVRSGSIHERRSIRPVKQESGPAQFGGFRKKQNNRPNNQTANPARPARSRIRYGKPLDRTSKSLDRLRRPALRLLRLLHFVRVGDEHLARLAALRLADDPLLLQQVDQAGGPRVADVEPPLQERGRDPGVLQG